MASNGHSSNSNLRHSSSISSSKSLIVDFPKAESVQPGTSPVEEQEKRNPIDETCNILVVGGNRGIGLEFVNQCLTSGATVIATHRSEDTPSDLESLQTKYPQKFHSIQMDLSSETSIENAASNLKDMNLGPLTHIIHNAGIYLPGTSFDGTARGPRDAAPKVDKETLMKTYEINTIAPLLVAQNFVGLMGKRSEALYPVYSFISSKVGSVDDNGSGGAYAYRSSKSALNNIAKSLSADLADEIRVVLLHPGWVKTDMTGGKGLIDTNTSVRGMLNAVESTDSSTAFRFVDYKACQIPW
jgi:NAD(P)-dependent dehydrogenase (short-subunit alcohol dehydrogenase family)